MISAERRLLHFSAEHKISIVLEGLRGEESIIELCRGKGIASSIYDGWSKDSSKPARNDLRAIHPCRRRRTRLRILGVRRRRLRRSSMFSGPYTLRLGGACLRAPPFELVASTNGANGINGPERGLAAVVPN